MLEPAPRGDYSNLKEPTISDLGVEDLGTTKPLIANFSVPILVHVVPSRVTPYECQIVLQAAMEENDATSLVSPHTHVLAMNTGGMFPPKPPSPVQTTVILNPSTSSSGMILSLTVMTASFM
jgi:hypothetical protein